MASACTSPRDRRSVSLGRSGRWYGWRGPCQRLRTGFRQTDLGGVAEDDLVLVDDLGLDMDAQPVRRPDVVPLRTAAEHRLPGRLVAAPPYASAPPYAAARAYAEDIDVDVEAARGRHQRACQDLLGKTARPTVEVTPRKT